MKSISSVMVVLLSSTFLSAPAWATETVNTYDDLLTALADENADVILDMNGAGIDLDGGNGITVGAGQTVVLKNIGTEGESAWTDTAFNIINNGAVAVDNVIFKENNTSENQTFLGSILRNTDAHVISITNSIIDSNIAETIGTSLWGGILFNGRPTTSSNQEMTNAVIDLIQNVSFTNNTGLAGKNAPHGAVILNQYAKIGTIDNVLFENNIMTGPADQSGGGHGVAIDNNEAGFIEKITNSTFKNNYSYRTGTQEFSSSTNYHASAGAIDNYNYIGEISSCVFEGNHTSAESVSASTTGGAIMNVAYVTTTGMAKAYIGKIVDTNFIHNYVESVGLAHGGAISSGNNGDVTESASIGEITNAHFIGNYAKSTRSSADGGAIHNGGDIGNITGDFIENYVQAGTSSAYGGAIYNRNGTIGNITGDFIENHALSTNGNADGGAIMNLGNSTTTSTIASINGNFINNYAKGEGRVSGGALNNNSYAEVADIIANFSDNYAETTGNSVLARGGAVLNFGHIAKLNGDFSNNYAQSNAGTIGGAIANIYGNDGSLGIDTLSGNFSNNYAIASSGYAKGGAIYNQGGTIGNIINSNFIDNYVEGNEESNGGAIWSNSDVLITADNGASLFDGNKVNGESNAIYMQGTPEQGCSDCEEYTPEERVNLNLSAVNNGTITFNDAIDGNIYNINVYGDGTGVVKFNNLVKNVTNFTLGANSITHLGLNSKVYAQNMNISTSAIPSGNAVSSPIITVDVEVDKANNTVNAGQIHVDNDIEGDYRVLVNSLNPDVLDNTEDAVVPFLFAPEDNTDTSSSFSVARVIGSPYLWDGKVNARDETEGSTWYLNLTEEENPDYVPPEPEPEPQPKPSKIYAPEVIAGIGLHEAAIEQTRSVVHNVKGKVAAGKELCPACGMYSYNWDGKKLRNIWALAQGESANIDKPVDMEAKIWGIEAGFDVQSDLHNTLGVFASYRKGQYDLSGKGSKLHSNIGSEIDINSYLAGLYYRYDHNFNWLFGTIYGGMQEAEVETEDHIAKLDTDGIEFGASIEFGRTIPLARDLTLDPSVGLYYTQVNFDDTKDNVGKHYEWDDIKHLEAELGAKLEKQFDNAKVYVKPSVIQTLTDDDSVLITGLSKADTYHDQTLGRIEIGGRYGFTDALSAYAWANYTFGSSYDAYALGAGLNYAW